MKKKIPTWYLIRELPRLFRGRARIERQRGRPINNLSAKDLNAVKAVKLQTGSLLLIAFIVFIAFTTFFGARADSVTNKATLSGCRIGGNAVWTNCNIRSVNTVVNMLVSNNLSTSFTNVVWGYQTNLVTNLLCNATGGTTNCALFRCPICQTVDGCPGDNCASNYLPRGSSMGIFSWGYFDKDTNLLTSGNAGECLTRTTNAVYSRVWHTDGTHYKGQATGDIFNAICNLDCVFDLPWPQYTNHVATLTGTKTQRGECLTQCAVIETYEDYYCTNICEHIEDPEQPCFEPCWWLGPGWCKSGQDCWSRINTNITNHCTKQGDTVTVNPLSNDWYPNCGSCEYPTRNVCDSGCHNTVGYPTRPNVRGAIGDFVYGVKLLQNSSHSQRNYMLAIAPTFGTGICDGNADPFCTGQQVLFPDGHISWHFTYSVAYCSDDEDDCNGGSNGCEPCKIWFDYDCQLDIWVGDF